MKTFTKGPIRLVYGMVDGAFTVHVELAETGERVSTVAARDRSKYAALITEIKAIMAELEAGAPEAAAAPRAPQEAAPVVAVVEPPPVIVEPPQAPAAEPAEAMDSPKREPVTIAPDIRLPEPASNETAAEIKRDDAAAEAEIEVAAKPTALPPAGKVKTRSRRALTTQQACDTAVAVLNTAIGDPWAPESWTAPQRESVNLCAMTIATEREPSTLTDQERAVIAAYSGWGGLSLDKARPLFPPSFPAPKSEGLIHEYYTPEALVAEIVRVLKPRMDKLPVFGEDGKVIALEPSAGIGRIVRALSGADFVSLRWTAVELSRTSAALFTSLLPEVPLFRMPFEEFIVEQGKAFSQKVGLIVSNPPYPQRGAEITVDPNPNYREIYARDYFLRRGLDLLAPGGIGVFLVPTGFLTGVAPEMRAMREKVLRRHHLAMAYRLPSDIFSRAEVTVDLMFFRCREKPLIELGVDDDFVLRGEYYDRYPKHVLGTVRTDGGRYGGGYIVEGPKPTLPDFAWREETKGVVDPDPSDPMRNTVGVVRSAARRISAKTDGLDNDLRDAVVLGVRVDRYLSLLAANASREHVELWSELFEGINYWTTMYGNPWKNKGLVDLAKGSGNVAAERFLNAFDRNGNLIRAIEEKPVWSPPFAGNIASMSAFAEHLFRANQSLSVGTLVAELVKLSGLSEAVEALRVRRGMRTLYEAGWARTGPNFENLEPSDYFYTGDLWPKYDAVAALLEAKSQDHYDADNDIFFGSVPSRLIEKTRDELMAKIDPVSIDNIHITPRDEWVPVEMLSKFFSDQSRYGSVGSDFFERKNGLLCIRGVDFPDTVDWIENNYSGKREKSEDAGRDIRVFIGYVNTDDNVFKPKTERGPRKKKGEKGEKEEKKGPDLNDLRLTYKQNTEKNFRDWIVRDSNRVAEIEKIYNRMFRGFVMPVYSGDPIFLARWNYDAATPHAHQNAAARRVNANRSGLLALDVGVGKTITALEVLALAKQQGWSKRPVIAVPNSIVLQWYRQIVGYKVPRKETFIPGVLPDYKVGVIGANFAIAQRNTANQRKGDVVTVVDSAEERGAKWTKFQAGEFDVMLVTHSMLPRTRINAESIDRYAENTPALVREFEIDMRNDNERGSARGRLLTERQQALREQNLGRWLALKVEPEGTTLAKDDARGKKGDKIPYQYDTGVAWDDLGVDLLIVDEAQNYKNLYLPNKQMGDVPKYMGNPGDGSNRAWNLELRCDAVRRKHRGGGGVVLLSATPAKNSPLEMYNMLQYLDHGIWQRLGIMGPDGFVARYMEITVDDDIDSRSQVARVPIMSGFIKATAPELVQAIYRYGEFKTAEEVKLKLPKPTINIVDDEGQSFGYRKEETTGETVYVDAKGLDIKPWDIGLTMSDQQKAIYESLRSRADQARQDGDSGTILRCFAMMSLCAVHPALTERVQVELKDKEGGTYTGYEAKWDWDNAEEIDDPESPKLTSCARRIARSLACTQVIVTPQGRENEALEAIVAAGTPAELVAVLGVTPNVTAKDFAGTVRTARKYEVVIGTAASMEAADLGGVACANYATDKASLEKIASQVLIARVCGHVVFCENLAAHVCLRRTLVEHGVPEERIAILNGATTSGGAQRSRIADRFNGNPDTGTLPDYDVVIANGVAYEGINLQMRTCAIHHIDLPWEPATLQQRNGRGVRQGNLVAAIEINYYFCKRSLDGYRFASIVGKANWLKQLIESQGRDTNNPGAQIKFSREDMLLFVAKDPEQAQTALAARRAARLAMRANEQRNFAGSAMSNANTLFRSAEYARSPELATRQRRDGEIELQKVLALDPEVWRWARNAVLVREQPVFVLANGAVLYEGMVIASEIAEFGASHKTYGRINGAAIGEWDCQGGIWRLKGRYELDSLYDPNKPLKAGSTPVPWPDVPRGAVYSAEAVNPESYVPRTIEKILPQVESVIKYLDYDTLGWRYASSSWLSMVWPEVGTNVIKKTIQRKNMGSSMTKAAFPLILDDGTASLRYAPTLDPREAMEEALIGNVPEPTDAGWQRWILAIRRTPEKNVKYGELRGAADYWWWKSLPNGLVGSDIEPVSDKPGDDIAPPTTTDAVPVQMDLGMATPAPAEPEAPSEFSAS